MIYILATEWPLYIFYGLKFKAFAAYFLYILSISYVVPHIVVYDLQLNVFLGNLVSAHTC
jgi:hypothetical protein